MSILSLKANDQNEKSISQAMGKQDQKWSYRRVIAFSLTLSIAFWAIIIGFFWIVF